MDGVELFKGFSKDPGGVEGIVEVYEIEKVAGVFGRGGGGFDDAAWSRGAGRKSRWISRWRESWGSWKEFTSGDESSGKEDESGPGGVIIFHGGNSILRGLGVEWNFCWKISI
mgnify:CR=1 FL=1